MPAIQYIEEILNAAPDREFMIGRRPNDARRRNIVVKRANVLAANDSPVLPKATRRRFVKIGNTNRSNRLTKDKLYQAFQRYRKDFDTCTTANEMLAMLQGLKDAGTLPTIDKVVCFGLGFLEHDGQARKRTCKQYATALNIAEFLEDLQEGKARHDVKVFAQDPLLTRREMCVLKGARVKVLNPFLRQGEVLVDSQTLVFSVNYPDCLQMTLEVSRPAMIICSVPEELHEGFDENTDNILAAEYDEHGDIGTPWEVYYVDWHDPAACDALNIKFLSYTSIYSRKPTFDCTPWQHDNPPPEQSDSDSDSDANGDEDNGEGEAMQRRKVDKLLDSRIQGDELQYRAQFTGKATDMTFYACKQFRHVPHLIYQFHEKNPGKPGPPHRL
ncbi:hypothetical protein F4778DRAFT_407493 [Xylariomycetidae sp. FL2044]|nr:hypothetical protein F4778DRAFT_407493 [Xylariomycetidae sp. FL2044]